MTFWDWVKAVIFFTSALYISDVAMRSSDLNWEFYLHKTEAALRRCSK